MLSINNFVTKSGISQAGGKCGNVETNHVHSVNLELKSFRGRFEGVFLAGKHSLRTHSLLEGLYLAVPSKLWPQKKNSAVLPSLSAYISSRCQMHFTVWHRFKMTNTAVSHNKGDSLAAAAIGLLSDDFWVRPRLYCCCTDSLSDIFPSTTCSLQLDHIFFILWKYYEHTEKK